jgi:hypothetical protein
MPVTDPSRRKKHAQLSMAISRAKKAGKDITELLAQRQNLISQRPKKTRVKKQQTKSREEINQDYYQKNRV